MIEPYYKDEQTTIYHGDCFDVLPSISSRVNAIITDPPFFMPAAHYQSRIKWQRSWADTSILASFWRNVLDVSLPILNDNGHFMTFCNGDSYPVFYPEIFKRFDSTACLVWDKTRFGLGRCWRHQHELIITARWNTSVFYEDGRPRSDIISAEATKSGNRNHPVEKPESLLCELMTPTTQAGDVVLDMFMGGGSLLRAARMIGRNAIGIEAEERYCEVAAKSLEQYHFFDQMPVATPAEQQKMDILINSPSDSATNVDAGAGDEAA